MRIEVCAEYTGYSYHNVELPEGKTWEDVAEWWVKWNTFFFKLKGEEEYREVDMGGLDYDTVDMKRPIGVQITEIDEDDSELEVLEEFA